MKICAYCGTENRDEDIFCENCGDSLDAATVTAVQSDSINTSTGTSSTQSLLPGSQLQVGRYVIKKILGEGGMGSLALASDTRLAGKLVVIKQMLSDQADSTEDARNFKQEVQTLAHIDHPLIPGVTDHFQEGSYYFMVQEFVEGENLQARMERIKGPMEEREALKYVAEVLDVLDYLEQQTPPIVHRDIKPANIIIGAKEQRAHLVDFGIARAYAPSNARRKQTTALGTPGYAPPEQYQGNAEPRSDLYALAATLYFLITNRDPTDYPPFQFPPARTVNRRLSPDVEALLGRALILDISQRYQAALEMKRDIDAILFKDFTLPGSANADTYGGYTPVAPPPYSGTQRRRVPVSGPLSARQSGSGQQQQFYEPPLPRSIGRSPIPPYQAANQQFAPNVRFVFFLFVLFVLLLGLVAFFVLSHI